MTHRPQNLNRDIHEEPALGDDERALERRLCEVRPDPISPSLRASLEGLAGPLKYAPSRLDRAARRALPWACAACLLVGFIVGGETRTTAPPPERPVATDVTRLVYLGADVPDERMTPWSVGTEREQPAEELRPGRGDEDLPRLHNPYLRI